MFDMAIMEFVQNISTFAQAVNLNDIGTTINTGLKDIVMGGWDLVSGAVMSLDHFSQQISVGEPIIARTSLEYTHLNSEIQTPYLTGIWVDGQSCGSLTEPLRSLDGRVGLFPPCSP